MRIIIYGRITNVNGTDQTNQQLLGQLTVYLKGEYTEQILNNLMNGIQPVNFLYQWGNAITQYIASEFKYYYITNLEHSNNWNGDSNRIVISNALVNLVSEWSTTTTIGVGVLDAINYYTNYNFLSWSNPISIPNIIAKNINLYYELFTVKNVGAVVGIGIGVELVEKLEVDSIKSLQEAGVNFSDLYSFQIEKLVEEYGVGIKDKLLHPENIQAEIISDNIYMENLAENSLGEVEENSASIDNNVNYSTAMEIESDHIAIYDTDTCGVN